MDPAMLQQAASMTPEQAKQMMDQLSPEEREQAEAQQKKMQQGMADLSHMVTHLKPSTEEPDAVVPMIKVLRVLASAPLMDQLGKNEQPLLGSTVEASLAKDALSKVEDQLETLGAMKVDELNDIENEAHWRNTVLLLWHMYKQHPKVPEDFLLSLPDELDHWRGGANQIATKLLIQCQMLMPQQRWVEVTLTVANLSALMVTALWSHTDPASLAKMAKITNEDGLPQPKLSLSATATWKDHPKEEAIPTGQHVLLTVNLERQHATEGSEAAPPCNNPQGIYEAYWLYVEGVKEGQPNSLVVAKPLVTKDLSAKVVTEEAVFQAPPKSGDYQLRIHIRSTSVVGIELKQDVKFVVRDDDVPDLE